MPTLSTIRTDPYGSVRKSCIHHCIIIFDLPSQKVPVLLRGWAHLSCKTSQRGGYHLPQPSSGSWSQLDSSPGLGRAITTMSWVQRWKGSTKYTNLTSRMTGFSR